MPAVSLSFSPCPNDIYAFFGWMNQRFDTTLQCTPTLSDIQSLNDGILTRQAEISKVSFLAFGQAISDYIMLPVGCALGYRVGPKLVGREGVSLSDLASQRVLVPGKNTTAYLLLRYLFPSATNIEACPFHEIVPRLKAGKGGIGLIVNESRFEIEQHGLHELADCGELWYQKTEAPLPLGCLVAKRTLPEETLREVCTNIRRSIDYARQNESAVHQALLQHSQEKDLSAALEHVRLYVNDDTYRLTQQGEKAIPLLFKLAIDEGLMQPFQGECLFRE